jgi:hypothetical protein
MATILFLAGIFSFISAYLISIFLKKKLLIFLSFLILPLLTALLIATRDPSNSFAVFLVALLGNLVLTPMCFYFWFNKGVKSADPAVDEVLMGDELEFKFKQFKKWFVPLMLTVGVTSAYFMLPMI